MSYHSGNQLVDPYLLFEKAQLRPGMHVADFGCGRTGHIVFPAAVILGEMGIMYAVDILKDTLETIQKRSRMDNLLNVQTVWADVERVGTTAIPPKSLEVIFLVNILTHAKDRMAILNESLRLLKDKARCVIVDWVKDGLPMGPKDGNFVNFEELKQWARQHDLAVQEEFPVGSYHKGVVLFKG